MKGRKKFSACHFSLSIAHLFELQPPNQQQQRRRTGAMESDSYDIESEHGFSWRQKHLLDAERPEENGPWNGAKSHPAFNEIAGEQSPLRRILCMTSSADLLFAGNTNSEIIVCPSSSPSTTNKTKTHQKKKKKRSGTCTRWLSKEDSRATTAVS